MTAEFILYMADNCGDETSLITSDILFRVMKEVTETGLKCVAVQFGS
jgi:hypothetical protein